MPDIVQKRRNFIINLLYFTLVGGLLFLFFKYLFWPLSPFLISFLMAACLQSPIRKIEKKTKWNHTFVSAIMAVLVLLVITGPLAALLGQLVAEIIEFIQHTLKSLEDFPTFVDNIRNGLLKGLQFLPENIYDGVKEFILRTAEDLKGDFNLTNVGLDLNKILNSVGTAVNGVYSVAKNVPDILLGLVIGIIAFFFLTKDYGMIVGFINRQLPEHQRTLLSEIKGSFFNTVGKMLRSYAIIMTITFVELFIGLNIMQLFHILDNDYLLVISIGIAVLDILPVLGVGTVLIPWGLYGLITGDFKLFFGMLILYLFVLGFRQYLEPKIVGTQLGVHPLVTLAGIYFGLKLFGFIGIFVMPLCIMTLKALNDSGRIHIWKKANPVLEADTAPKKASLLERLKNRTHKK